MKREFKIGDAVKCIKSDKLSDYTGEGWLLGKAFIIHRIKKHSYGTCIFPEIGSGVYTNALELIKSNKPKLENPIKYMAYGTSCNNKSDLMQNEKELKTKLKEYVHDSSWTGEIIGYQLTPLYKAEKSVTLKKVKIPKIKKKSTKRGGKK